MRRNLLALNDVNLKYVSTVRKRISVNGIDKQSASLTEYVQVRTRKLVIADASGSPPVCPEFAPNNHMTLHLGLITFSKAIVAYIPVYILIHCVLGVLYLLLASHTAACSYTALQYPVCLNNFIESQFFSYNIF